MLRSFKLGCAALLVGAALAGCGGGGGADQPLTYDIYVAVNGLTGTGLVLQNNAGDDLTVNANGTIAITTRVANGAAYSVTVLTQPTPTTQVCTVSSGSGTVSSANVTINVDCAAGPAAVAYVVTPGLSLLRVFLLNASGPDLGKVSTYNDDEPMPASTTETSTSVAPNGKFVFQGTGGSDNRLYSLAAGGDRKLTPVSSITASGEVTQVTAHPTKSFVYAINVVTGGMISAKFDPVTGILTSNAPAPLTDAATFAIAPNGLRLYALYGNGSIEVFSIDQTTGALSATGVSTGSGMSFGNVGLSMVISPNGRVAYAGSRNGKVYSIAIDPGSNAVTAKGAKTIFLGTWVTSLTVGASDGFLYAALPNESSIAQFVITDPIQGTLLASTLTDVPPGVQDIALDPSNQYIWVTSGLNQSVEIYPIANASGDLGTPTTTDIGSPGSSVVLAR